MQPTPAQKPYCLIDEKNQTIFATRIWSKVSLFSVPVSSPRAIFLGGQSGGGKSSIAKHHLTEFRSVSGAVVVNSDALREYHPQFSQLQRTNPNQASFLVNPDTIKWQQQLIAATVDSSRNLILDGTLGGDPDRILQTIKDLFDKGYSIQLGILAVPALLSRLGIYERYETQIVLKGIGCWVGMETHDRLYEEIPRTITLLEASACVDRIHIYGRSTSSNGPPLLYENWVEAGHWHTTPRAANILTECRNRPWSLVEQKAYQTALSWLKTRLEARQADEAHQAGLARETPFPLIYRPAQPSDVQLYFDWANDPVTRQQSFNTEPIPWENHSVWFSFKLADLTARLLVFETQQGEPVGQIRFERRADEVVIGISLDAAIRGRGLAPVMIWAAVAYYQTQFPGDNLPIHAYIRPDNRASIRSFEKAGFSFSHESGKFGVQSVVYVYSNSSSYHQPQPSALRDCRDVGES